MVMPNSEPASRTKHSRLHQKALYYSDLKSNLIIMDSIHLLFEKAGGDRGAGEGGVGGITLRGKKPAYNIIGFGYQVTAPGFSQTLGFPP